MIIKNVARKALLTFEEKYTRDPKHDGVVDFIEEAIRRRLPEYPVRRAIADGITADCCPNCLWVLRKVKAYTGGGNPSGEYKQAFCPACGQAIDWRRIIKV